jgi:hypothetical protein
MEESVAQALLAAASIIVFVAALPATAFPIVYAIFFRWQKYDAGRTVMASAIALAGLIDLSIILTAVDESPLATAVATLLVLLAVLAGSTYSLVVLLRKLYIQGCSREENSRRFTINQDSQSEETDA